MTKALLIGDCHITDDIRRPASRKPGYEQQILDKLMFCVTEANKKSLPVIGLGDLFNLKSWSKNSYALVQSVHDVFAQANHGVWLIFGNHDGAHSNFTLLNNQPLGALCRMTNVNLLQGLTDDLPGIAGIPYLTQFDDGGWQEALSDNNNFYADKASLILTHAPIFPKGQEPGVYASITPDDWSAYFPDVPFVAYGHIHDFHSKHWNTSQTTLFSNAGAISRGSLHEETINRQPRYTIFTGNDFEYFDIPVEKPEEVYLFDEAAAKAVSKASAADFAAALGQVSLRSLTLNEIYVSLRNEVTDPNVMKAIELVLEDTVL